jgi:DNA-binding beta-propeller fold protein YncE
MNLAERWEMIMRMKRSVVTGMMLAMLLGFVGLGTDTSDVAQAAPPARGVVVVANRASGNLSVIDVVTDTASTVLMPAGTNTPEPMYVVHSRTSGRVFVGDRANDRVVAFDARDWSVDGMVAAGSGVFHMWADPQDKQIWVNNDIDNTSTVFNPRTLKVLATVSMPADLVTAGGKPHDVVLDNRHAYVSLLGAQGWIVKFSKKTFQEVDRAMVGDDPHVSLTQTNGNLYVPAQGSNTVQVLDRRTLDVVTTLAVPGAHGAGMAGQQRRFYTTNLPGGGTDAIFTIDTKTNALVGSPVDAPFPVPHNIALTHQATKMYVTHSGGTADKVTVFDLTGKNRVPVYLGAVTVGLNPFGLAYVK